MSCVYPWDTLGSQSADRALSLPFQCPVYLALDTWTLKSSRVVNVVTQGNGVVEGAVTPYLEILFQTYACEWGNCCYTRTLESALEMLK